MPLDFTLTGSSWDTTLVLWNNLADQTFQVHASQLPTTAQLDPGNWILKTATLVSVNDQVSLPVPFRLEQNRPNPFNPVTTIEYHLSQVDHVTLLVYDALGREVARLVDEVEGPGYRSVQWDATGVSSGVYLYRLAAGGYSATKRLVLMK